jgi:hypothetical protein
MWSKIDDGFSDHPKVIEAGPLAGWLFVCGLCYCAKFLTDGFIPAAKVRRLADVDNAADLAARLVAVGLWEPRDGGYQVHDYLDYQYSKAQSKALQLERAKAGREGGKKSAAVRAERKAREAKA